MNTEEMRAEFELKLKAGDFKYAPSNRAAIDRYKDGYAHVTINDLWRGYQAGRAESTEKLEAQIARMAGELTAAHSENERIGICLGDLRTFDADAIKKSDRYDWLKLHAPEKSIYAYDVRDFVKIPLIGADLDDAIDAGMEQTK